MPTGYTIAVHDGETSFRDFVLRCARGMAACIHQRDEYGGGLPRHKEVDTKFHDQYIAKAQADLRDIEQLPISEWNRRAGDAYGEALADWRRHEAEKAAVQKRYQEMHRQVSAWKIPSPDHEAFKLFMLKQLEESEKADCTYHWSAPEPLTGYEYREQCKAKALRDLEYHRERRQEEIDSGRLVNTWIDQLYASLPPA